MKGFPECNALSKIRGPVARRVGNAMKRGFHALFSFVKLRGLDCAGLIDLVNGHFYMADLFRRHLLELRAPLLPHHLANLVRQRGCIKITLWLRWRVELHAKLGS